MISDFYLERFNAFPPFIADPPNADLGIIVVIPSYKEPNIIPSLESLSNCKKPDSSVEIIVVINSSEKASSEAQLANKITVNQLEEFKQYSNLIIHIIDIKLPNKTAGVGYARKVGMDEAYRRFLSCDNLETGIISCFDADSVCQPNYLQELEAHFHQSKTEACSIHYEHQFDEAQNNSIHNAIIKYELHLRYYMQALRFAGHLHAYQTIGSSMAVRAVSYGKEGGMNKKKAGEDFYFLMKYIQNNKLNELNSTTILPSARTSDRVPFGTGRAMIETLEGSSRYSYSYNIKSVLDLKFFIEMIPKIYASSNYELIHNQLPESFRTFFKIPEFVNEFSLIKKQTSDLKSFTHRTFYWFNGFMAMKYMHYCRDHYYPNEILNSCCYGLLKKMGFDLAFNVDVDKNLLLFFRKLHLDYSNT